MDDVTKTDKMLSRKEGSVGYVIFNNPERHNAVSLEMWARVAEILESFRNDDEVRVVVITGAGGKSFVSGADISRFESERSSLDATKIYNQKVAAANSSIYEFPKPTIAMIKGYCIGGGLGLAVCCDLRICSDNSKFGIPAAKLGLGYSFPGVKRLSDLVGPAFAKEIFFTARQFDAEEARVMGLVNRVVKPDELEILREDLRRDDRRQRAADGEGRKVHCRTKPCATRASATWRVPPRWSKPASPATTTPKAAAPSWRSASRSSRGPEVVADLADGGKLSRRQPKVCFNNRRQARYNPFISREEYAWRRLNCGV